MNEKIESLKKTVDELTEKEKEELVDYLEETRELQRSQHVKFVEQDMDSKKLKIKFKRLATVWSDETRIRTFATIKILEALENLGKSLDKDKESFK